MKKGVPIEGRVIDADGKPVAGARVLSTDYPQSVYSQLDEFTVLTDDRGRFRTGQVNPGEWHLIAQARGHSPGGAVIKLGSAIPRSRSSSAVPMSSRVALSIPRASPSPRQTSRSTPGGNTEGLYCRPGPMPTAASAGTRRGEDITLSVNKQGFRSVEKQFAPSTEDVVFTLEPVLWIQGKLTDAETGNASRTQPSNTARSTRHPANR